MKEIFKGLISRLVIANARISKPRGGQKPQVKNEFSNVSRHKKVNIQMSIHSLSFNSRKLILFNNYHYNSKYQQIQQKHVENMCLKLQNHERNQERPKNGSYTMFMTGNFNTVNTLYPANRLIQSQSRFQDILFSLTKQTT